MSIGIDTSSLTVLSSVSSTDQTSANQTKPNLRALTKLDLSDDQRQQIRSVLQNARQNALSPQDVNTQIQALLAPGQQQQLASLSQNAATQSAGSQANQNGQTSGDINGTGPFSALQLTSGQQQQISQIFDNAQSESPDQIKSQIDSVLTPTQKQQLAQSLSGPNAGSSNVQSQIAAAASINQHQLKTDLSTKGASGPRRHGPPPGGGGGSSGDLFGIGSSTSTTSSSTSASGTANTSLGAETNVLDALTTSSTTTTSGATDAGVASSAASVSGAANTSLADQLVLDEQTFLKSLEGTLTSAQQNVSSSFFSEDVS